jgi:hypothetical protein
MKPPPCDSPKQDTEGVYYCPHNPDWEDEEDCELCAQRLSAAIEREVERRMEARLAHDERLDERDVWGG